MEKINATAKGKPIPKSNNKTVIAFVILYNICDTLYNKIVILYNELTQTKHNCHS